MFIEKQHDEQDCGAACLSTVSKMYGISYPLSKYRELTKTDRNGTNLYGLVDAACKLNFNAEALFGEYNELIDDINNNKLLLPFIAHTVKEDYSQHFVVVYKITKKFIYVADPETGKKKYTFDEFKYLWSGYIVSLYPSENFKKGNYRKGGFLKFFIVLKKQLNILIPIIILSLIISFVGILGSFVFQTVLENYSINLVESSEQHNSNKHINHDNHNSSENLLEDFLDFFSSDNVRINDVFLALIILYALCGFIQFFRGVLISTLSKRIDKNLILSYYNHIINLSVSEIEKRNTGEYLSRLSDASAIREAISGATITLFMDTLMVIVCGILLININIIMFLISLFMVLLYFVIVLIYKNPIEHSNRKMMANNAIVESYLKETIDGVETIKANCAEEKIKKSNTEKFFKMLQSVFCNSVISFSQESLCITIELIGTILILWTGFLLSDNSIISIGDVITFYVLLAYFTQPIKNLIELQPQIQSAYVAADRLNDVLDIENENNDVNDLIIPQFNNIEFENVNFRYGNNKTVINNLSLKIKKGEKVAIVGESGCGKSTIVKLLMNYYQTECGRITIDNKNICDINIKELRSSISYITQDTFLFSDTIKNNLTLGTETKSMNAISKACRIASIDKFINEQPLKYNTSLEENAKNLSGGQKQRLSIARALLRKPKILIMDEATRNIDIITEEKIIKSIFKCFDKSICIIISHQLSVIKKCDKIIFIKKGTISESGTHEELIAKKGDYYNLFNTYL